MNVRSQEIILKITHVQISSSLLAVNITSFLSGVLSTRQNPYSLPVLYLSGIPFVYGSLISLQTINFIYIYMYIQNFPTYPHLLFLQEVFRRTNFTPIIILTRGPDCRKEVSGINSDTRKSFLPFYSSAYFIFVNRTFENIVYKNYNKYGSQCLSCLFLQGTRTTFLVDLSSIDNDLQES